MTDHKKKRQPMQPVEWDGHGVVRFKSNPIVRYLLDAGGLDLNDLARAKIDATVHDWDQFNMLIGYSVSGAPLRSKVTQRRADDAAASYIERWPVDPEKDPVRRAAIEKLTPEERRALGVE